MPGQKSVLGKIRGRSLLEVAILFIAAYSVLEVAPAVTLRIRFLNEMELAANSPIEMTASDIKRKLLQAAEGLGLTLLDHNLGVVRDRELRKTIISARYQIFIHFWPAFTYAWNVKDEVEGYFY